MLNNEQHIERINKQFEHMKNIKTKRDKKIYSDYILVQIVLEDREEYI